jgi:hypothetical protein
VLESASPLTSLKIWAHPVLRLSSIDGDLNTVVHVESKIVRPEAGFRNSHVERDFCQLVYQGAPNPLGEIFAHTEMATLAEIWRFFPFHIPPRRLRIEKQANPISSKKIEAIDCAILLRNALDIGHSGSR